MSEITRKGFYAFLSSQAAFTALVASDPSGGPALYPQAMVANPQIFPQVVYLNPGGRKAHPDPGLSSVLFYEDWDFLAYTDQESDVPADQIADTLRRLLHEQVFPLEHGEVFYLEMVPGGGDGFRATDQTRVVARKFRLLYSDPLPLD